jgi:hypothetical protein
MLHEGSTLGKTRNRKLTQNNQCRIWLAICLTSTLKTHTMQEKASKSIDPKSIVPVDRITLDRSG